MLYAPEFRPLRSDPEIDPYALADTFTYHDQWTSPLFRQIAFIFRVMCIDPHEELQAAWAALQNAQFPPAAMQVFEDVSVVDYATATGRIRDALNGDKIREVQLAKELSDHFRAQYLRAKQMVATGPLSVQSPDRNIQHGGEADPGQIRREQPRRGPARLC